MAIWFDRFCQISVREKRDKSYFPFSTGAYSQFGFYLYRVDLERKRLSLEKKFTSQPPAAAEKLMFCIMARL